MTSCATSDSRYLVLNCAEERMQIVLGTENAVLFGEEILCPGQSIRHLPTAIERALAVQNVLVADLTGIACVSGPGSFTGLRIAHASMYALARPQGIPMAGLEYLALLAAQAAAPTADEVWILTYARKGSVYAQGFAAGQPIGPIQALTVAQAREFLATRPNHVRLVGSGARKNPVWNDLPTITLLPEAFDTPWPISLLAAARTATYSRQTPVPLYVRKSDAEDNLETIAHARGIQPAKARKEIFDFR